MFANGLKTSAAQERNFGSWLLKPRKGCNQRLAIARRERGNQDGSKTVSKGNLPRGKTDIGSIESETARESVLDIFRTC
jgi:hypothetical protein